MKKTLYYLYNEVSLINDELLTKLYFMDIDTDEMVIINITKNKDKYYKLDFGIYYESIDEIKDHYNILWKEDDKYIYPLEVGYEKIKSTYKSLKLTKC